MLDPKASPTYRRPLFPRAILAGLCLLAACGGGTSSEVTSAGAPLKECEAFLDAFHHCLGALGPAEIAEGRVAEARASLEDALARGSRESVRAQCVSGLAHMTCR